MGQEAILIKVRDDKGLNSTILEEQWCDQQQGVMVVGREETKDSHQCLPQAV